MCGIAGAAGDRLPLEVVKAMADAVGHRGPDETRMWTDGNRVALGFRRLSIIDLETGSQPLANETGTVIGACNGEIYNFQTLRASLENRGHRFSSRSDAEVIVHCYEDRGLGFLHELEGMFALALWDASENRLVLARDRMGVKPLYFAEVCGGILYGSEPSAILASGLVKANVDPDALADYFTLQYVRPPHSGFQKISKLAPGEYLVWKDGRAERRRWWRLQQEPDGSLTTEEALERTDAILREATRRRLVADVPLGAFLSGGVDSSLVVSYMAELGHKTKTFSVDFPVQQFSEGKYAGVVAQRFGTEHTQFELEPDVIALAPTIVEYLAEPFADSSAIPTYALSEETRKHVTVALSGDGGDEAFGGYRRYLLGTRGGAGAIGRLTGRLGGRLTPLAPRPYRELLERGFRSLVRPDRERYAVMMSHFDPEGLRALCTPEFLHSVTDPRSAWNALDPPGEISDPSRLMQLDLETYLPGDVLTKVDRMSMAHALEVRSPLLAYPVQEFAATLPLHLKLRGTTTKWLLKELACRRGVPPTAVFRPKSGFGVPVGEWFRTTMRPWVEDVLLDPRTTSRGIVRRDAVERLLRNHVDGRQDHGQRLWNLVMLELWHRRWVDHVDPR